MQRRFLLCLSFVLLSTFMITACSDSSDHPNNGPSIPDIPPDPEPEPEPEPLPTTFLFEGEDCTTPEGSESRTLYITPDCVDPELREAYIDEDEQQTVTDPETGITVSYRYVHGGFTGTEARFAFYFPATDEYLGRFFQTTYPTVGTEGSSPNQLAFSISNGAYVVSSNNGGGVVQAPSTGGYRVNVASARVSQMVAKLIYGENAPTRGYIYGVSGGSLQTIGAVQRSEGVYAGSVPIVPAVPNAIPSFQSVQVLGLRVLQEKFPDIVDALQPGGSGDPYATLDDQERAILEEVTKMGFPPRGWWQWERLTGGSFDLVVSAVTSIDGNYADDFYNITGYEGFDDPAVQALRVQFDTTIASVSEGSVTLADEPQGYLEFADLVVTSGEAEGNTINLVGIDGAEVSFAENVNDSIVEGLAVGDQVRVDNSLYIALQFYPRHQVPDPAQYGWNQYRDVDGEPIYAQRPVLVGPIISNVFGGVPSGDFNGKMIMLASTMDVEAYPWSVDWFRTQALGELGSELGRNFRLWYSDNADHVEPRFTEANAHIVSYFGVVEQALLYLDDWVANGISPPASSRYEITEDNQVELPPTAGERRGVQPLVSLAVTAGDECGSGNEVRVNVEAGDPVSFLLTATAPEGTGNIVRTEWDFYSTGEYLESTQVDSASPEFQQCMSHAYDETGTHFAVVRVTSQRDADAGTEYGLVQNLARVRIVVE